MGGDEALLEIGCVGVVVRCFWVEWSWCVWVSACGGSFDRSFAVFLRRVN